MEICVLILNKKMFIPIRCVPNENMGTNFEKKNDGKDVILVH